MPEIRFYAPEAPNFEQSNILARLAMEQRQKAVDGFRDTVKGFTNDVKQNNHSLIKQEIDALTPEQLQDKAYINEMTKKLTADTGYMYDRPVVDAYVEARPDILQERALNNLKLQEQEAINAGRLLSNDGVEINNEIAKATHNNSLTKQAEEQRLKHREFYKTAHTYFISQGDHENANKIREMARAYYDNTETMLADMGLAVNKYTHEQENQTLTNEGLQAKIEALRTQANVAQQNADTNQFKARNAAETAEANLALKALETSNPNGDKGSNSNSKDPIQKSLVTAGLKKLTDLGLSGGLMQQEDGTYGLNYNTINSAVQAKISQINEAYITSDHKYEEMLNSNEYMQGYDSLDLLGLGGLFGKKRTETLKNAVNNYSYTNSDGTKRPLRPDEKEEIYRNAVNNNIRFSEWFSFNDGFKDSMLEPFLKRYNNDITNKTNKEITNYVADVLSSSSQITGMTNAQIANAMGWGRGTNMFKVLPKSVQKDINKKALTNNEPTKPNPKQAGSSNAVLKQQPTIFDTNMTTNPLSPRVARWTPTQQAELLRRGLGNPVLDMATNYKR